MNAVATKSQNLLQGIALTTLLQGLPTFASAAMLIKVFGVSNLVAPGGSPVLFVVLASLAHGLLVPWLARKFPRHFSKSYEPLFFDAGLPMSEKILRWRTQPASSLQLLSATIMLSVLAVAVLSMR